MTEKVRAEFFIATLTEMLEDERRGRVASPKKDETRNDRFSSWLKVGVDGVGHHSALSRRKAHSDRSSLGQPQYR